jgi:hypothetical protein
MWETKTSTSFVAKFTPLASYLINNPSRIYNKGEDEFKGEYIEKRRSPGDTSPSLLADLPWLTARQWGILASLYVLRR